MPAPQVRAMAEPFPPEGLPLPEARGRVLEAIHPLPGHETCPGRLPGAGEGVPLRQLMVVRGAGERAVEHLTNPSWQE
jgi:hypothetical protein